MKKGDLVLIKTEKQLLKVKGIEKLSDGTFVDTEVKDSICGSILECLGKLGIVEELHSSISRPNSFSIKVKEVKLVQNYNFYFRWVIPLSNRKTASILYGDKDE